MENNMKSVLIKTTKSAFTKEHKQLVKVLKKGSRAKLKQEARKQQKEMNKY